MTDYDQARSSEGKGKTATTETYWAECWRSMAGNAHGEALISPIFAMQGDLTVWLRPRRWEYEECSVYRRKNGHDEKLYTDEQVELPDDLKPDPERLAAIIAGIKQIAAGKGDEDGIERPY